MASRLLPCALFMIAVGWATTTRAATGRLRWQQDDWSHAPYVRVHLLPIDHDAKVVRDVRPTSLTLFIDSMEQGTAREVTRFEDSPKPIEVQVVMQLAGQAEPFTSTLRDGYRGLARAIDLGKGSSVGLIGISDESELPEAIQAALARFSHDPAPSDVAPPKGRRRLLLIVAADPNVERRPMAQLGRQAAEANVVIDTIVLGDTRRHLVELSKQSNGIAHEGDLSRAFATVVDEINLQLIATFFVGLHPEKIRREHGFQVTFDKGDTQHLSNNVNQPIWEHCLCGVPDDRWYRFDPERWQRQRYFWIYSGFATLLALGVVALLIRRRR